MTDLLLKTAIALISLTLMLCGCNKKEVSDEDLGIDEDNYDEEMIDEDADLYEEDYYIDDYGIPEYAPPPDRDYEWPDEDLFCQPSSVEPCYTGPEGTAGVGPCKEGTRLCKVDGSGWEKCEWEVLPTYDICDDGIDQDCDGTVDNLDMDFDGYTECGGLDCCSSAEKCPDPQGTHPDASEIPNNCIDDNCNGEIDEVGDSDELLGTDADCPWFPSERGPWKKR